jgi:hypothetical protein
MAGGFLWSGGTHDSDSIVENSYFFRVQHWTVQDGADGGL